jgi:hypothetical protein
VTPVRAASVLVPGVPTHAGRPTVVRVPGAPDLASTTTMGSVRSAPITLPTAPYGDTCAAGAGLWITLRETALWGPLARVIN